MECDEKSKVYDAFDRRQAEQRELFFRNVEHEATIAKLQKELAVSKTHWQAEALLISANQEPLNAFWTAINARRSLDICMAIITHPSCGVSRNFTDALWDRCRRSILRA